MSNETEDHYALLGISRNATAEQIRRAARKIRRPVHPDNNKTAEAREAWHRIDTACTVLSDPQKRFLYDLTLPSQDESERQRANSALRADLLNPPDTRPLPPELIPSAAQFQAIEQGDSSCAVRSIEIHNRNDDLRFATRNKPNERHVLGGHT